MSGYCNLDLSMPVTMLPPLGLPSHQVLKLSITKLNQDHFAGYLVSSTGGLALYLHQNDFKSQSSQ